MSDVAKAEELLLQAQKKLKGGWFFGGGSTRYEEASELYIKAANIFKMAKRWKEAGDAFVQSADCLTKAQSRHEAATNFVQAANCYRKTNAADAISKLKEAVGIFTELGRFSIAAKHQKEIAEIYESDLVDLEGAIAAYQLAADWYQGEESKTSAQNCLLKVALFSAQLEKYDAAIQIYEDIASQSVDNSLLRWSVKEYFLRAGICRLCSDVIAAQTALRRYEDMDPTFSSTREAQFLHALADAVEQQNVEEFTNTVVQFDSFSKLDNWKTTMLLRVKRSIREESSLT